ncbi:glycosyltransferase family 22 protein [Athelia psychrophila]|uniref:Mannosyltransferase n=1 Tax=Athelia psychrophila TaxID=1759441 RepID=A0A166G0M1_9AGAM|nr:glycosyltransferase family 22 protein [Fibularhizoctonia sp. CBS 109695]
MGINAVAVSDHIRHRLYRPYVGLLLIRVFLAISGTGYIHPDEYFQNGEVTAGRVLGYHALRTWEWEPAFAIRSILPPFATTGLPFLLAKLIFGGLLPSPRTAFYLERLTFLALSMLLDFSVWQLVDNPTSRAYALLLLASSHVMHTFQVRPFSNSLEAVLVVLCFVLLRRLMDGRKPSSLYLHAMAVLCVLGLFTRVTFMAFALPVLWQCLRLTGRTWPKRIRSMALPSLTAAVTALAVVSLDTYVLCGDLRSLVITPLNFLKYNLSPHNLSEHGIHPRWLHLVVNLPMMVGPPLLWLTACAAVYHWPLKGQKARNAPNVIDRTLIYAFLLALFLLSLQPHQEPRFLLAFPFMFVVFVANSGELQKAGRVFWTTWVAFNISLTLIFGVLHQGGVVPSLFHMHHQLSSLDAAQNAQVIYWKTYMPPWHLLAIPGTDVSSGRIRLTDLAGAPVTVLEESLADTTLTSSIVGDTITYLVAPFAMKALLPRVAEHCLVLEHAVFPHLDLDHIGESIELGWKGGLSLGIWTIDTTCIGRSKYVHDPVSV